MVDSSAQPTHPSSGHLGTDGDVRIDGVGRRGSRQKQADSGRVGSVERDEIRASLPNQPGEPRLPGGFSPRHEKVELDQG